MRPPSRLLLLLCAALALAACGPEAPPRAERADPEGARATPLLPRTSGPLLADRVPNPRALGDPAAPIVVVEHSDFQ